MTCMHFEWKSMVLQLITTTKWTGGLGNKDDLDMMFRVFRHFAIARVVVRWNQEDCRGAAASDNVTRIKILGHQLLGHHFPLLIGAIMSRDKTPFPVVVQRPLQLADSISPQGWKPRSWFKYRWLLRFLGEYQRLQATIMVCLQISYVQVLKFQKEGGCPPSDLLHLMQVIFTVLLFQTSLTSKQERFATFALHSTFVNHAYIVWRMITKCDVAWPLSWQFEKKYFWSW